MAFTLCTSGAIVTKAGENADATAIASGAILEQFSNEAEAYINAVSRHDWIANFSTIATNTKTLLGEACSNLGGIYVIQYNMSGFSTIVEAEDMVNILWARLDKVINLLKDQKVVDFINGA